jgi:hypothetical protein
MFDYCLFPLRKHITDSREVAYARGYCTDEEIRTLDVLYWLLNNAHGIIKIAGVYSSDFPFRETPLEEFIF